MPAMDMLAVQKRLHKLGFNPGEIDGVRGRQTINAIMRFQELRGLVADGIVGPATSAALFGAGAAGATPTFDRMPWFDEAQRLRGLRENPKEGASNPEVVALADVLDIDYKSDDIPWCGLFTGHCIATALPAEPLPNGLLGARSWERFGQSCPPQRGAVMVFWRVSKRDGRGHVGFYSGEDRASYHILGGNQSDMVSVAGVPKERFVAARWPLTALAPTGAAVVAEAGSVAASTREE